jgi:hypothetical protein
MVFSSFSKYILRSLITFFHSSLVTFSLVNESLVHSRIKLGLLDYIFTLGRDLEFVLVK